MKPFLFWFGFFSLVSSSSYGQNSGAIITWDKNNYDFGDMVQGKKAEHVFKFTNSGNEPLLITNVEVTCGCTTPKGWPRDPVNPGGRGEIEIQFDSTLKIGRQHKVIVVISNAKAGNSQVTFTANVLERKN